MTPPRADQLTSARTRCPCIGIAPGRTAVAANPAEQSRLAGGAARGPVDDGTKAERAAPAAGVSTGSGVRSVEATGGRRVHRRDARPRSSPPQGEIDMVKTGREPTLRRDVA